MDPPKSMLQNRLFHWLLILNGNAVNIVCYLNTTYKENMFDT